MRKQLEKVVNLWYVIYFLLPPVVQCLIKSLGPTKKLVLNITRVLRCEAFSYQHHAESTVYCDWSFWRQMAVRCVNGIIENNFFFVIKLYLG